ncbi:MAG: hypothetical protein Q7K42_01360 [Candidatus Diapherotrites archaeon]|nr:hypothetical protein [Candidatus Diapherotrites archaeon]
MLNKGQIVSLDINMAAVIDFASIGFLVQAHEISALDTKELQTQNIYSTYSELAAEKLLLSDLAVCGVKDQFETRKPGYKATHCIDLTKAAGITKAQLGLPANVKCNIIFGIAGSSSNAVTACNDAVNNSVVQPGFNSVTRKAISSTGAIFKNLLETCIKGLGVGTQCDLEKNLVVSVWSG